MGSITTLGNPGVINEVLEVTETHIRLQSQQSHSVKSRALQESLFRAWWEHLTEHGSASLSPGDSNNPRTSHSILAKCLPDRTRYIGHNTIELIAIASGLDLQ
jgi:hypothetical protein